MARFKQNNLQITYIVVDRSRREAAHHAGGLHPALLVVRVLLIALDH